MTGTAWPGVLHTWGAAEPLYSAFLNATSQGVNHNHQRGDQQMALVAGTNAQAGDLVVDSASGDNKVIRTTIAGQSGPIWVTTDPLTAGGTTGWVRGHGFVQVNVAGSVAAGAFLRTSGTAGQAEATTDYTTAFGQAITGSGGGAGLVQAFVYGGAPGRLTLSQIGGTAAAGLVLATPSGTAGQATLRALAVSDLPAMPICSLTISGLQSITNNTEQPVLWDTETSDAFAMHSTVTNTDQIVIPTGYGGTYRISASLQYASNTTGLRGVELYINGAFIKARYAVGFSGAGNDVGFEYVQALAVGDVLKIYAYQTITGGGALNITTNSAVNVAFLSK